MSASILPRKGTQANNTGSILDFDTVELQVRKLSQDHGLDDVSEAFSCLVLTTLFDLSIDDAQDALTEGGNDRGIDAVVIDDHNKVIRLFQFKHVRKYEKARSAFPRDSAMRMETFFADLTSRSSTLKFTCNPILYSKMEQIWEYLDADIYRFEIYLCSNATPLDPHEMEQLVAKLRRYQRVEIIPVHLEQMAQLFSRPSSTTDKRELKFIEDQLFERTDGNVRGLQCSVKGEELIKFLADPGNLQRIDIELFRDNVRLFMGHKNSVNASIRRSIDGLRKNEFWYLNNGITIVCKSFDYQPGFATPIHIVDPQIVNGCQTAHEVFSASRIAQGSVKGICIPVKIIQTSDASLIDRVAEATNSQTSIRSRDLQANDEIQLKLAASFEALGLFYERKRNQFKAKPKNKRLDSHKAGQAILAYYLGFPEKAKTSSEQIFGSLYSLVFDASVITAERILVAYQLLNLIEQRKELAKREMRSVIGPFFGEAWLVEGVFHVLYVVAGLCRRDGVSPDQIENAEQRLDEAVTIISEFVKGQKGAAAYRIFRFVKTRSALLEMIFKPEPQQMALAI